MTPITEVDQLRAQNALLLRRLLVVSRERDQLAAKLAEADPPKESATADAR